jgi:uncharacterized lipoprotein
MRRLVLAALVVLALGGCGVLVEAARRAADSIDHDVECLTKGC